jgi:TRAP-type mannitol/chloroaromatic compound transport system permease small subunit
VPFAFVKHVVQIAFFYDCNYFSFRIHEKCPLSGGKVPFAFVKNVVQIAFCMIAVPHPVASISGKIFQMMSDVRFL